MASKEIKLEEGFRALKDVEQKQLVLKHLVNFSAKKVEELEKSNAMLNEQSKTNEQILIINKKLSNQLSNKINRLEIINDDLESQVRKKTEDLIKSERLAAIGKFSSNLAHDLRNPLSVIKITAQLLQGKPDINDIDKEKLGRILEAIDSISYQINDVLNFVKKRPPRLETVSMQNVIVRALKNIQIPKGISLEMHGPNIQLLCDVEQMRVVFTNLLSNAVEAIGQSGKISISAQETDDKIIIEFKDSGPGIPEDKIIQIFDALFTTKETGTGLGLASVTSILEMHHGKISAKNNPTRFIVELPN